MFLALVVALSILAIIELRRSGFAPLPLLFLLIDTGDEDTNCDLLRFGLVEATILVRLSVGFSNEELIGCADDDDDDDDNGGGGGGGIIKGENDGGSGGGDDALDGGGSGGNGG